MGKIIFGYWRWRGRAEPARLMMHYAGVDYEEVNYDMTGEHPNYDMSSWTDVKFKLGFDFPNLPYLIDGDIKMTESWAIFRYLGRKFNMAPTTEKEKYTCDMLEGVLSTLRSNFAPHCYKLEVEEVKKKVRSTQPPLLRQLDRFLEGRKFLAGERITFVDFPCYEILDYHRLLIPDFLDEFKNLQDFIQTFESLERIAAYMNSGTYQKFPILKPYAKWGGKKM